MKDIQYIQIFGERNSGTNFLHKTIESNLIRLPEIGPQFGWKHGFTNRQRIKKEDTNSVLFICMFKDPYAWFSSMHEKPHHAPQLYNMEFSNFIRTEWACYKGKKYHLRAQNLELDPILPEQEMMQERHPKTKERFKNVIELRNTKNKYFLNLKKLAENVIYLRYEDFYLDPASKLREILAPFDLECKEDFHVSNAYHGKSQKLKWDKKEFYREKKYLEKFSEEDLDFVNEHLDFELEHELGYEFVEMLKK